MLQKQPRR